MKRKKFIGDARNRTENKGKGEAISQEITVKREEERHDEEEKRGRSRMDEA